MKEEIIKRIAELENSGGYKVLFACETGSRAWGFPSPDSDYDVRLIYKYDSDWYLSLVDKDDSINMPINDELDITGWEFRKCLKLLWKSNAALLERIQSPIVYTSENGFIEKMNEISKDYFSPIAVMHHYLSMSKKYYDLCMDGDGVKLKKYFYAIRTAIAGMWVREVGSIPHIEMPKMFDVLDAEIRDKIEELIAIKLTKNEDYIHSREPLIDDFLIRTIKDNESVSNSLPAAKGKFDLLDEFYRSVIKSEA